MALLTATEAKTYISTSLDDAVLIGMINAISADVYRASGGKFPLNRLRDEYLHLVMDVSEIAGGNITFSQSFNLGQSTPNLHSITVDISEAELTAVFRVNPAVYRSHLYRSSYYRGSFPSNLLWSMVFSEQPVVYFSDEWDEEGSEEGKLCTLTAAHEIASFTTDSAAAYGTLTVDEQVHFIGACEAPSFFMPADEFTARQKQIAIDLLRILVVDDGVQMASVRVEDLTEVVQRYGNSSMQYGKRMKQARALRGFL